tara:strand:- start:266 stop:418 length:153 start_codon:yes stop_codon:yes gene_type:complete
MKQKRKIIASKILVQWDDDKDMIALDEAMPSDLDQAFCQWLTEIENEENQ